MPRQFHAENLVHLRHENVTRRAGGEPRDQRVRHVRGEKAEAKKAHHNLQQSQCSTPISQ